MSCYGTKRSHIVMVWRWGTTTDKVTTMLLKIIQVEKAPFQSSLPVFPISRVWREKAPWPTLVFLS